MPLQDPRLGETFKPRCRSPENRLARPGLGWWVSEGRSHSSEPKRRGCAIAAPPRVLVSPELQMRSPRAGPSRLSRPPLRLCPARVPSAGARPRLGPRTRVPVSLDTPAACSPPARQDRGPTGVPSPHTSFGFRTVVTFGPAFAKPGAWEGPGRTNWVRGLRESPCMEGRRHCLNAEAKPVWEPAGRGLQLPGFCPPPPSRTSDF